MARIIAVSSAPQDAELADTNYLQLQVQYDLAYDAVVEHDATCSCFDGVFGHTIDEMAKDDQSDTGMMRHPCMCEPMLITQPVAHCGFS